MMRMFMRKKCMYRKLCFVDLKMIIFIFNYNVEYCGNQSGNSTLAVRPHVFTYHIQIHKGTLYSDQETHG